MPRHAAAARTMAAAPHPRATRPRRRAPRQAQAPVGVVAGAAGADAAPAARAAATVAVVTLTAAGIDGTSVHGFPAYVGLGSNLRDPQQQVRAAFDALAALPATLLVLRSSFYRSSPMGPVAQPDYCNAVAGLLTELDARSLFAELRRIEMRMGREPARVRWGPRVIDLDLLVYGSERWSEADLVVPHPGIPERNFVLQPLAEIAPDLLIPGLGRVATLAAGVPTAGLWKFA
jgi:2-amino-4-hydroxy-6-hydroxymethyldihydropteridine diphosphokinase